MNARRLLITGLTRLLFCMAAVVVAGFALYPNLQLPEPALTKGFTDKIYHVAGCLILVLLAAKGWRLRVNLLHLAIPLSIGLEVVQGVVPGRGLELLDMLANLGGIALAILFLGIGLWGRECKAE